MKKAQARKFWRALHDTTSVADAISSYKNRAGYGGERTLERYAQADKGFTEALAGEEVAGKEVARRTGWSLGYVKRLYQWWQEVFPERVSQQPEPGRQPGEVAGVPASTREVSRGDKTTLEICPQTQEMLKLPELWRDAMKEPPKQGQAYQKDMKATSLAAGDAANDTPTQVGGVELALSTALANHWADLAHLAKVLADSVYVSEPRNLDLLERSPDIPDDADALKALWFVQVHSDRYIHRVAEWQLYPHLLTHLRAEDPNWDSNMNILRQAAVCLCRTLHALTRNVEEESEEWTGLPYDRSSVHGLCYGFTRTVMQLALSGGSCGYETKGGALFTDQGERLAVVRQGDEEKLAVAEQVHRGLVARTKRSRRLPTLSVAYDRVKDAIKPIRDMLELVSLRCTFKGKCPACP